MAASGAPKESAAVAAQELINASTGAGPHIDALALQEAGDASAYLAVGHSALEGSHWGGAVDVYYADLAAGGADADDAPEGASGAGALTLAVPGEGDDEGVCWEDGGGVAAVCWVAPRRLAFGVDDGDVRLAAVSDADPLPGSTEVTSHRLRVRTVASMGEHDAGVACVDAAGGPAAAGEDALLLSASDDCTVKLWHVGSTGAAHSSATFAGHTAPVRSVRWQPGSRSVFASGGMDLSLRLWDAATDASTNTIRTDARVMSVAWAGSSAPHLLVGGLESGVVRVWDVRAVAKGPLRDAATHAAPVCALAYSAARDTLASGGDDATIRLSPASSAGAEAVALEGHTDYVRALLWSGSTLLSGGWDKRILQWRVGGSAPVAPADA